MAGLRVTEKSISSHVLAGLQNNIAKLGDTQQALSTGKLINQPSDNPGGTAMSMEYRSDMTRMAQYARNADDGMSWLDVTDGAISGVLDQIQRAHELVLSGMSSGSYGSDDSRQAIALEVDSIRDSALNLANTTYLDRPVFGGTTNGGQAYDASGTYVGDAGQVLRTASNNTTVRVDTSGADLFGTGNQQLFQLLDKTSDDLRNHPENLSDDLNSLTTSTKLLQAGLSGVGSRYNELSSMQSAANNRSASLTSQLSDIEDIDLPKTITDLSLQQSAYQAALAATARVVQPSLVDFLR